MRHLLGKRRDHGRELGLLAATEVLHVCAAASLLDELHITSLSTPFLSSVA
jgi:hypothetical protein